MDKQVDGLLGFCSEILYFVYGFFRKIRTSSFLTNEIIELDFFDLACGEIVSTSLCRFEAIYCTVQFLAFSYL